ncbi:hypothetical protein [Mucilaginibacter lacusdianchii]|uniref:hypothetical protein n=1 Tax=Mucilaginibacter lacusdianchii TaxID=2684211 RepID=UPI00131C63EA|nr:hypothetical protein [Mucilaginibacter sp. JXJ CY 39]
MSDTTRGWLAFAILTVAFYAIVSFTQLTIDFTDWSVTARTVLIAGTVAIGIFVMWLTDPPT